MSFTPAQTDALVDACRRLNTLATDNAGQAPRERFRYHNVVGILGPRGSGKSTVLEMIHELTKPESRGAVSLDAETRAEIQSFLRSLYVLPSLDCSVLDARISPGTAVLLRLHEELTSGKDRAQCGHKREGKDALKELRDLVDHFTRLDDNYKQLCVDLAVSPNDYSYYLAEGLKERLTLQTRLSENLEQVLKLLGHEAQAIVILLDDFDLVPAQEVRHWLMALLDELHQTRLLFVLTADYHRLQHLSWDAKNEFDDLTGWAIINKLLAEPNRITLEPWSAEERARFPRCSDPAEGEGTTLWGYVEKYFNTTPTQGRLLQRLLPQRPRGLANLYERLREIHRTTERKGKDGGRITLYELMEILANCRQEPLLARRLREAREQQLRWVRLLTLPDKDVAIEDWNDMVVAATQRQDQQATSTLMPFAALERPADPVLGKAAADTDAMLDYRALLLASAAERDPLRHEYLYRLPLRDVNEMDYAFWSELLIDSELIADARRTEPGSVGTHVHFLNHCKPLHRRLVSARLSLQLQTNVLYEAFDTLDPDCDLQGQGLFPWFRYIETRRRQRGLCSIQVGWSPLLENLRSGTNQTLESLSRQLNLPLLEHYASDDDRGISKLLPNSIAGMILLLDGLDRCPWRALSMPRFWRLTTYVSLAAALVQVAYTYAVTRRPNGDSLASKDPEVRRWLDALIRREPGYWLRMNETALTDAIKRVFDADTAEWLAQDQTTSLTQAARNYLACDAYRKLRRAFSAEYG